MDSAGTDPTKQRLLEAAGEEFAARGFEAATVRAICKRAGTNVAAVNYHFGDKENLYLQAVLEAHRCGMGPVPVLEAGAPDRPPADRLRGFIREFLERVLSRDAADTWRRTLMFREMLTPTVALETLVRESIRPRFGQLLAILGRICPEATPERLRLIGFSVIGQCLHYKIAAPVTERLMGREAFEALDVDELTDHIAGFTLAALGLAPPLDAAGRPAAKAREAECPGSR